MGILVTKYRSKVKLFAFEVSPSREKYLENKVIKLLNQIELNEYSKFLIL